VQEYIKKDICVEVCPLSNFILGYTYDLRNHPIRDLSFKGLQFSISPDDPGFFDYKGVTLDYAYATLAWELEIRDLKKISLNGIKYSSISEEKKEHLYKNVFPQKW
jgi:adenosine deaminase CECR1